MLKQDVPLRTGWFGYRKLDVENCIAHIRAAYAAELRLARQTQQGMEETMAQLRQENKALRRENADLEAACEQAREELQMAVARAEKTEQQAARTPACPEVPVQAPPPEPPEEAVACCARSAAQPAAQPEPVWQPETELEKLSVELLRRFDEMMQE